MKRYAWRFLPLPGEWYGKLIECKCDINESETNKKRSSFMQNQFYNLLKWYLLSNMCPIGDVIIVIIFFRYGTWKRCEWPTNDTKRNSPQKYLKKNRIIINSNTDRYQNTKYKAVSVINWCTSYTRSTILHIPKISFYSSKKQRIKETKYQMRLIGTL